MQYVAIDQIEGLMRLLRIGAIEAARVHFTGAMITGAAPSHFQILCQQTSETRRARRVPSHEWIFS
jgi:hypothetical protein